MADTDFISTNIQSYYTNTTGAATFRTGGSDGEDGAVKSLDARIASFEQVIIDKPPSGFTNAEFPYDKEGLKKEFLDEVLAMLLARATTTTTGTTTTTTYAYARTVTYQLENFQDDPDYDPPAVPQIELIPGSGIMIDDPDYDPPPVPQKWVASGSAVTISPMKDGLLMGSLQQVPALTLATQRYAITSNGLGNGTTVGPGPTAAVTYFQPVKNFDDLQRNAVDANNQVLQLLSTDGMNVYKYYSSLIDQVFVEGDELKKVKDPHTGDTFVENGNQTLVVTAIEPVVFDGVTYTHVTSFRALKVPAPTAPNADKYDYFVHLVDEGLETYVPMKVPIVNSNVTEPRVVGFQMGFTDATTKSTKYLPVELVNGEYVRLKDSSNVDLPPKTFLNQRNMYIDDYLYFWNEARTGILRAQLAYKEAVTREMQEDLRQANDALAELERQSALTDGNDLNKTSVETLTLDLWEAKVGKAGDNIFNNAGNDDIQNFSTWQESRTNLKNYIDRKSAQSQQAMLDYQTVLNRFNNAFEVMSKIQEKIDSLLKGQLRNYN